MTLSLAIYDDVTGRLNALDPANATGIGIPAFRSGAQLPATGTVVGEGFMDTTSGMAFVWDGSTWIPVVPGSINAYPTDSDLLAATPPDGTYGSAKDTGNLYIRVQGNWKKVGIQTYPDLATMLADTPVAGTEGIELATGKEAHYINGDWKPTSTWLATEATILAATGDMDSQTAVATDTGHMYIWDGTNWIGSPVMHYPDEPTLQADTPADGVLAFADDSGLIYARANGAWKRVNSPTMSVGTTAPATPASGDLFFDTDDGTCRIFDGTNWNLITTPTVKVDATEPANPVKGDLWFNTSSEGHERLLMREDNDWTLISQKPRQYQSFSIGSAAQGIHDFATGEHPQRYFRMRGLCYASGAQCKLAIIGKLNGAWIDWDAAAHWGWISEKATDGAPYLQEEPAFYASGTAGITCRTGQLSTRRSWHF